MSILNKVKTEVVIDPPRLVIYGKPKAGKSTLVSQAEKPLTACFEDGAKGIKTPTYQVEDYNDFKNLIKGLLTEEHEYKTLNIDSITFLEKALHEHLCKEYQVSSIELVGGGYGKGFTMAEEEMWTLLTKLDMLCSQKRMTINFIGHQVIADEVNTNGEDFKQARFDGNKKIVALLERWSDGIILMTNKVFVKKEDKGFGNSSVKATGGNQTVLVCGGSAGALAKTRYDLPNEIPVTKDDGWNTLMEHIRKGVK